jgi:hypothetical protein
MRRSFIVLAGTAALLLAAALPATSAPSAWRPVGNGGGSGPMVVHPPAPTLLPTGRNLPVALPVWTEPVSYSRAMLRLFQSIALANGLHVEPLSTSEIPYGEKVMCQQNMMPLADNPKSFFGSDFCGTNGDVIVLGPRTITVQRHASADGTLGTLLYSFAGSQVGIDNDWTGCYAGTITRVLLAHHLITTADEHSERWQHTPYGIRGYDYGIWGYNCEQAIRNNGYTITPEALPTTSRKAPSGVPCVYLKIFNNYLSARRGCVQSAPPAALLLLSFRHDHLVDHVCLPPPIVGRPKMSYQAVDPLRQLELQVPDDKLHLDPVGSQPAG